MKKCQFRRSDMTPCVIVDGSFCYAEDSQGRPICVGCERAPNLTGVQPPKDWKGAAWEPQT